MNYGKGRDSYSKQGTLASGPPENPESADGGKNYDKGHAFGKKLTRTPITN